MKKILYLMLFVFVSAISISACTEEVVAPTQETGTTNGTGTTGNDPIKP